MMVESARGAKSVPMSDRRRPPVAQLAAASVVQYFIPGPVVKSEAPGWSL